MRLRTPEVDLSSWPVAILAGGLATRLRPATEKTPKALLTIAGEPFIIHQLRLLHSHGFRKLIICVGYLADMIEDELSDGSNLGMQIVYSSDKSALLGTGGALKRALPKLGQQFLVVYGDSYMPVDYCAIVKAFMLSKRPALMTVFKNEGSWDVSNIWFEGGEIHSYEKKRPGPEMRYIDYGIAVLSATVFASFPYNVAFDLADVYSRLVSARQMAAYEVKERFYEIGSRRGLAELDSLLRKKPGAFSP